MIRVYIADAIRTERAALRLVLLDQNMEIAGEADDWSTTLVNVPTCRVDLLIVDWELLPSAPKVALDELRKACPKAPLIILISHLQARQQAALSVGADMFISKGEMPDRVIEHLSAAVQKIRT